MATKQATLADVGRGGYDPAKAVVTLFGSDRAGSVFDPVKNELAGFLLEASDRVDGLQDSSDAARQLIDDGSPTGYRINGECRVFCFGDSDRVMHDLERVIDSPEVSVSHILVPAPGCFGETAREIADNLAPLCDVDADVAVGVGVSPYPVGTEWRHFSPGEGEAIAEFLAGVRAAGSWGVRLQREASKDDVRRWADWDMDGGRAPLGFTWTDEELVPAPNYTDVCACLEMVQAGEMSKRKAAAHLGTSPRTITRSIEERAARYGLR